MAVIHDLCPELISLLASHIDKEDLLSFRSVCKAFHEAAQYYFVDAFIVTRHHVASSPSLQVLINILKSPVLGPFVQTIIINAASDFHTIHELEVEEGSANEGFIMSPGFQHLLIQVFDHVKCNRTSIELSVSSEDDCYGMKAFKQVNGQKEVRYLCFDTFVAVVNAASEASCPVRTILSCHGKKGGPSHSFMEELLWYYMRVNDWMHNLKCTYALAPTASLDRPPQISFQARTRALESKNIKMAVADEDATEYNGKVPFSCADTTMKTRFEKLRLVSCTIDGPSVLMPLLESQKNCLTSIVLNDVNIVKTIENHGDTWTSWGQVLNFFADKADDMDALESVELTNIGYYREDKPKKFLLREVTLAEGAITFALHGDNIAAHSRVLAVRIAKEDKDHVKWVEFTG